MGASSQTGWGPCPPGEFGRLSGRLTARRHRRLALGVVVGATLAVGAGWAAAQVGSRMLGLAGSAFGGGCPTSNTPVPIKAPPGGGDVCPP